MAAFCALNSLLAGLLGRGAGGFVVACWELDGGASTVAGGGTFLFMPSPWSGGVGGVEVCVVVVDTACHDALVLLIHLLLLLLLP